MIRPDDVTAPVPFWATVSAMLIPAVALFMPDLPLEPPDPDSAEWCVTCAGMQVEPHPQGGVTVMATDGHAMLAVYDPTGRASRPAIVCLPRRLVDACARPRLPKLHAEGEDVTPPVPGWMLPKTLALWSHAAWVLPDVVDHDPGHDGVLAHASLATGGTIRFGHEYRELAREPSDWRSVLPETPYPLTTAGVLGQEYWRRFGAAADVLGAQGLRISGCGEGAMAPRVVEFIGVRHAVGVLMPVDPRAIPEDALPPKPEVPAWARPLQVNRRTSTEQAIAEQPEPDQDNSDEPSA